MTKEDIIAMAREAGFEHIAEADYWHPLFERFAALVASAEREYLRESFRVVTAAEASAAILHEREACARVCDEFSKQTRFYNFSDFIAKAIRARNNQ